MTTIDRDLVPGMAEAIEARRRERGLAPGEFATAAGVSSQALKPLRRGEARDYQDKVTLGVARALLWPLDWYDRLRAGDDPETLIEPSQRVVDAIEHDPLLDDLGRRELLRVYHQLIG